MALPLGTDINVVGQGASGGDTLGAATTNKISFYGTTAISQRSAAGQTALTLTTSLSSGFGFTTSAGFNAMIAQLAEVSASLIALGLWKGS